MSCTVAGGHLLREVVGNSSMVERTTVNRDVVGSSPIYPVSDSDI